RRELEVPPVLLLGERRGIARRRRRRHGDGGRGRRRGKDRRRRRGRRRRRLGPARDREAEGKQREEERETGAAAGHGGHGGLHGGLDGSIVAGRPCAPAVRRPYGYARPFLPHPASVDPTSYVLSANSRIAFAGSADRLTSSYGRTNSF